MDYGYRFSGALHPAFHTQKNHYRYGIRHQTSSVYYIIKQYYLKQLSTPHYTFSSSKLQSLIQDCDF